MDVKYISFHGYIRNTPSDTEVHAEHQLSGQECLTRGEEYIDPSKTQQGRGTKEKNRSVSLVDLPLAGGGTEAAVPSPHRGSCLSQRRNI